MRLIAYKIENFAPLKWFEVSDLSDTVVLAGPNGVGKTRLLTSLLNTFQNPGAAPTARAVLEATSVEEQRAWGAKTLDTSVPSEAAKLRAHLQRPRKRGHLQSGIINFDSARQLEQIQPYAFTWDFRDPFTEDIGWNFSLQPMKGRFQDTIHSLHRKLRSQKEDIAKKAMLLQAQGVQSMDLDFKDPLEKFYEAFTKLLPGRELITPDERTQGIRYRVGETELPLDSLSSGEREVVTVVFDFLLRDPQDCIIVFDEPELHLHPELSYRLLRTLRDVGERNQFIFSTHSPDIITASLDQSVVFLAPPHEARKNQAIQVGDDDEAAHVLHLIGQSIGVISLGKRIVLIEGTKASLDKQTYGAIVGPRHPDLVLVPVGGKDSIGHFAAAFETVLSKTIWGVDFFMLCDGDTASGGTSAAHGRIQLLPRYHVENYFLDEHVLARSFEVLGEPEDSWLRSPSEIRKAIREIAQSSLSYAASLNVAHRLRMSAGNVDLMPPGCHDKDETALVQLFEDRRSSEAVRVQTALDKATVEKEVRAEVTRLAGLLAQEGDQWLRHIPGKTILQKFSKRASVDAGRLKRVYLRVASTMTPDPFQEVRSIFQGFSDF